MEQFLVDYVRENVDILTAEERLRGLTEEQIRASLEKLRQK